MIPYISLLEAARAYYAAKVNNLRLSKTTRNDAATLRSIVDEELAAAERGEPMRTLIRHDPGRVPLAA